MIADAEACQPKSRVDLTELIATMKNSRKTTKEAALGADPADAKQADMLRQTCTSAKGALVPFYCN